MTTLNRCIVPLLPRGLLSPFLTPACWMSSRLRLRRPAEPARAWAAGVMKRNPVMSHTGWIYGAVHVRPVFLQGPLPTKENKTGPRMARLGLNKDLLTTGPGLGWPLGAVALAVALKWASRFLPGRLEEAAMLVAALRQGTRCPLKLSPRLFPSVKWAHIFPQALGGCAPDQLCTVLFLRACLVHLCCFPSLEVADTFEAPHGTTRACCHGTLWACALRLACDSRFWPGCVVTGTSCCCWATEE